MIAKLLQTLLGAIGPMLLQIFENLVEKHTFDQVVTLAQVEVQKLMGDTSMDNATKRATVLAALEAQLKPMGISVSEAVLNLAVESAVNFVKAKTPAK